MPTFLVLALLAVTAGASVMLQQVLSANLRTGLNSAAWSGLVSYALGLAWMILLVIVVRDPVPSAASAARVPWWQWSAGTFGALFLVASILLIPKLGAATYFALLISGQMLASVAFDHFGLLGLAPRQIDLGRLADVVLLIGGVILIRR